MSGFRRYGRKPLKYSVTLFHQDVGDIVAETQDVSKTGVFIRSTDLMKSIAVGDEMDAHLHSEENPTENTHLKAVRLTTEGVGFAIE